MSEKNSEGAGLIGGALGAAGGSAASAVMVSASGAVAGTSAAGITSGLAALGSVVGGDMMAGVAVAAVPAVIGGYVGYKLFKKIFS